MTCTRCKKTSEEVNLSPRPEFYHPWYNKRYSLLCEPCLTEILKINKELERRANRKPNEYCHYCDIEKKSDIKSTNFIEKFKERFPFLCEKCFPLVEKKQAIYLSLPKYPDKEYLCIEKINEGFKSKIGTGERYKIQLISKDWVVTEVAVSWIYSEYVVLEFPRKGQFNIVPQKNCGHRYVRMSYEQIEKEIDYPYGSYAARAVARNEAEILYPTPENPKRLSEVKKKREKYVDEHWRKIHPSIVEFMPKYETRQRYHLCDKKWRIYDNDLFLDKLKEQMIPKDNLFKEFLENDKT